MRVADEDKQYILRLAAQCQAHAPLQQAILYLTPAADFFIGTALLFAAHHPSAGLPCTIEWFWAPAADPEPMPCGSKLEFLHAIPGAGVYQEIDCDIWMPGEFGKFDHSDLVPLEGVSV